MRAVVMVLVLVAGCDYIFNLHGIDVPPSDAGTSDTGSTDAPPAVTKCTTFGSPHPLANFTVDDSDPAERGDEQEMWFTNYNGVIGTYRIFGVMRTSKTAEYGTGLEAGVFSTGGNHDLDPTVTADGQDLLFTSDRAAALQVYETVRGGNGIFGNATYVPLVELAQTIAISADGLTLYYDDGVLLREVDRRARTAPFGNSTIISAMRMANPSVTADELQVYYRRGTSIYRQTRATRNESFATEESIVINDATGSATISFDGTTLIYQSSVLVQEDCL